MSGQRNIRRSWRAALVGMILLRVTIGLPAPFTWPSPASGEDASPVADASLRRLVPLTGGWLIKQLDNDQPDLAALTRESASPDKTWLSARMPAQVHDVLVAHGLTATKLGEISLRSQFLHATFAGHDACCLLISERYLHLPETHLGVRRVKNQLEITTDNFARQVTLRFDGVSGAVFEDNFFDLLPGQKKTVGIVSAASGRRLTVCALNAESVAMSWDP